MSPELTQIVNNLTYQMPFILATLRPFVWIAALIIIGVQVTNIAKGKTQEVSLGAKAGIIFFCIFLWTDFSAFNMVNNTFINDASIDVNTKLLQKYELDTTKGEFAPLYRLIFLTLGIFAVIMFYVAIFKAIRILGKKSNETYTMVMIMMFGAFACYNAEIIVLGFGKTVGGSVQTFIEKNLYYGSYEVKLVTPPKAPSGS